jgi:hypothetical protein
MPTDYFISYRKKAAVRALGAPDPAFFAEALNPLVRASWLIAGCTCFPALETARIDVIASAKEAAEQADFGSGWRMVINSYLYHHLYVQRSKSNALLGLLGI